MKKLVLLVIVLWAGLHPGVRIATLFIGDHAFTVEIADTVEKRVTGLMFRENIPPDFGMLFVFEDEARRHFWMKNTPSHLDIIFLNREKQVVQIYVNVPPCRRDPCELYDSIKPARFVLELRGKRSQEINLKVGDTVFFILD